MSSMQNKKGHPSLPPQQPCEVGYTDKRWPDLSIVKQIWTQVYIHCISYTVPLMHILHNIFLFYLKLPSANRLALGQDCYTGHIPSAVWGAGRRSRCSPHFFLVF